jgi:hypothetical protein
VVALPVAPPLQEIDAVDDVTLTVTGTVPV